MSNCNSNHGLSESQFELVFNRLLNDLTFRNRFYDEPKEAIKDLNINIRHDEINRIKDIIYSEIKKNRIDFNEKLVLCSSCY